MNFNFHSDNFFLLALQTILNWGLGLTVWAIWLMWVTGFRFNKDKRRKFNENERAFREEVDQKWEEYRERNTFVHHGRVDTVNEYGDVIRSDYYSKLSTPLRRSVKYTLILTALCYGYCFVLEKIADYNSYLGILTLAATVYLVWLKFKDYLLYDKWYMRFVYSIASYVTVFVSILQIIDSFAGTNKI
ncbi:hypothetical protein [Emticicia sp. 17c]|uniref:hypothetical protein n=1 Tax=Emticicia sp. 17c TaxID=3127704 RepID=UPI00301C23D0